MQVCSYLMHVVLDLESADFFSSSSSAAAAELTNPAAEADLALAYTISPVRISLQCGTHPGGNLHSDGISICAEEMVGTMRRRNVMNRKRKLRYRTNVRRRLKPTLH